MTDSNHAADDADESGITVRPTVRPPLILAGITLLVGGIISMSLYANPRSLGGVAEPASRVVTIITVIATLGFLWKMYLLRRTEYRLRPEMIERRYDFLYRKRHRKLPIQRVRGYELDQGRIEGLLGYGTVVFLSGGTNQSLGFLEFESVPDPQRVRQFVDERLDDKRV